MPEALANTQPLPPYEPGGPVVAVLFADIAGSTSLYEVLGDARAKAMIDEALAVMKAVTAQQQGRVIKTIGDEIMCVFPAPDRGFLAACDMQTRVDALPIADGAKRKIRVGFHAGPVIEQDNDVFGDTVNTAARMAGLAKGMQIFTTRATVDMLPVELRAGTREIAALAVKGKAAEMSVCEVIWQEGGDLTMTADSILVPSAQQSTVLLRHGAREVVMSAELTAVSMGREGASTFVIADPKASRNHARIEKRRDKYFLADQSTNGTFVTFNGEPETSLRREEVMLRGSGFIVFGHSAAESKTETLEFTVRV